MISDPKQGPSDISADVLLKIILSPVLEHSKLKIKVVLFYLSQSVIKINDREKIETQLVTGSLRRSRDVVIFLGNSKIMIKSKSRV